MFFVDSVTSCLSIKHITLTSPLRCLLQARMALDKGAKAVIFDVSDDANAAAEVSVQAQFKRQLNLY